jgi:hypothetical protein
MRMGRSPYFTGCLEQLFKCCECEDEDEEEQGQKIKLTGNDKRKKEKSNSSIYDDPNNAGKIYRSWESRDITKDSN